MYNIRAHNVPQAWQEFIWTFGLVASPEQSRNGPVMTCQEPAMLEIQYPMQRVLFDPARDANPFFHAMEFVWMMSGDPHVEWITQFNKSFTRYSDDGKTFPASYGVRWRHHWDMDQIGMVISHLQSDPTSRRAILQMWDPSYDLVENSKIGVDRPCNTTISFRIIEDKLNMLVFNRSNDAIWGMFGANCVHMTMLQELVARAIGVELGWYRVITHNLHIYSDLPNLKNMMQKPPGEHDYYGINFDVHPFPLLSKGETYSDFIDDAEAFVQGQPVNTRWFRGTATYIKRAYTEKSLRHKWCAQIEAPDWRVACTRWSERRL